jgi:hypothetical protein
MILSYRIAAQFCDCDAQFDKLLAFLGKHRSAVDEIAIFSEWYYAHYPLEEFARFAELLGTRIRQLRKAGVRSVGINLLCTMGFEHVRDFVPAMPFPPLVGHDGALSSTCPCPNSVEFRNYIRKKYALAARTRPDFIWVDDDVRMHHHGMGRLDFTCFCPRCLAGFKKGRFADRAELVAKLNAPDGAELRADWVSNNARVIGAMLRRIANAVHKVDPGIDVGLMTAGPGWSTYSGMAFGSWMKTLGGRRARPGGGFYTDTAPRDMLAKAWEAGRQCHAYPPSVDNIQYEFENYPYARLGKSIQSAMDECLLALAVGCNGIAFNSMPYLVGGLEDYDALLKAIAGERSLWASFLKAASGLPLVGFWPVHDNRLMAKRPVADGNWFAWEAATPYAIGKPEIHAEIGLPLTMYPESACGVFLSNRLAEIFTDRELRRFLGGAVVIDGPTLEILWQRGLGALTGVRPGKAYASGVREVPSDHPFNGPHAGDDRDLLMASWAATALPLVPLNGRAEGLSRLVGYDGSAVGTGMAIYENEMGGRVATLGYDAWALAGSTAKRTQLLNVADWVTRGAVPVRIDRTLKVVPFARLSPDRKRFAVVLLNASLDPTGAFDVRLRLKSASARLLTRQGSASLPAARGKGELVIRLPSIGPWQTAVLAGP